MSFVSDVSKKYSVLGADFDFIDPDDVIARETFDGCIYEPSTSSLLKKIFSDYDGLTFIDVGAHYGYFTCFVSKISPATKVIAFEPGRKQVNILRKNIAVNRSQAEICEFALSDKNETVGFTDRTMKVNPLKEVETIKCVKFDDIVDSLSSEKLFIKVDVHGAEGKVLSGMKESLKEKTEVLMVELHAENLLVDYTHKEIMTLVMESGLHFYELQDFRGKTEPVLVKITEENIGTISDPSRWTAEQVNNERMIIGFRSPL